MWESPDVENLLLVRTVIHLYEPTSGTVTFDGMKVDKSMSRKQAHELTGRMQMIFQDPYASLNPRRKIMDIVGEGLDAHGLAKNRKDKEEQVVRLLETVGLQAEHADRFPHEFSGGQRQRVGIARALAVNPDLSYVTNRFLPGCFDSGAGCKPAGRTSGKKRADISVHCP